MAGGAIKERDCASGEKCFTASWNINGADGYKGACIDASACDTQRDIYKNYDGFKVSMSFSRSERFFIKPCKSMRTFWNISKQKLCD